MPFTAKWWDPEIIILNEVRERQISDDITYMGSLKKKNNTNELIYKTEIDIEKNLIPRAKKKNSIQTITPKLSRKIIA